ncbi:hypothetical protein IWQ60_006376 [Tieghemiomyces parasiticus]|uniref:Uncharacterized protein n=1 Tax=Tieghemiomyces parasiticus TaxID=78921 RepID=A0A9W8A4G6_9FUNG|nr:hypothetical protein IWQ60_006376 [Tieghemiomyces parasiticus]
MTSPGCAIPANDAVEEKSTPSLIALSMASPLYSAEQISQCLRSCSNAGRFPTGLVNRACRKLGALSYYRAAQLLYTHLSKKDRDECGPLDVLHAVPLHMPAVLHHVLNTAWFCQPESFARFDAPALRYRQWICLGLHEDPDCPLAFRRPYGLLWRDVISKQFFDLTAHWVSDNIKRRVWETHDLLSDCQRDYSKTLGDTTDEEQEEKVDDEEGTVGYMETGLTLEEEKEMIVAALEAEEQDLYGTGEALRNRMRSILALVALPTEEWVAGPPSTVNGYDVSGVLEYMQLELIDRDLTANGLIEAFHSAVGFSDTVYAAVFSENFRMMTTG